MQGTFKGWVPNKQFGFIAPEEGGADVFAHKGDAPEASIMTPGAIVRYSVVDTEKGRQAKEIELLSAGRQEETDPDFPDIRRGRVKFVSEKKGYGFIEPDDRSPDVFFSAKNLAGQMVSEGDLLEFATMRSEKGKEAQNMKVVGWREVGNAFSDMVQITKPNWLTELDAMDEEESWEYKSADSNNNLPILNTYIKYTFLRLTEMPNGISYGSNEGIMAFNTGLVTPNQEAIYGFCSKSSSENTRPWIFSGWYKESNRLFVDNFATNLPPLGEYFDNTSDLLFDRRLKLYLNIDHVLENIGRFPKHLQENTYMARQLLTSAQVQTEKRVYRNYKTAIPQYFRDRGGDGKIQLLLPICLENPSKADLALTVEKNKEGTAYLSSTVLTLDMAYNNARLLARPDTEWLQP